MTLVSIAEYAAPAATMIAACMTAANLGARITGWGFIVFTVGSLAWSMVAFSSGQQSLLLTNGFLTIVNALGVWRWLGRIARFDDGAKAAEHKSRHVDGAGLLNVGSIAGQTIANADGNKIGKAIGVMASAANGRIAYVVVGLGGLAGVGERLVAVRWDDIEHDGDQMYVQLDAGAIDALDDVDPADWPAQAQAA